MPDDDRQELRLLAIVPAYNEEGMIGRVVRDIDRHAPRKSMGGAVGGDEVRVGVRLDEGGFKVPRRFREWGPSGGRPVGQSRQPGSMAHAR